MAMNTFHEYFSAEIFQKVTEPVLFCFHHALHSYQIATKQVRCITNWVTLLFSKQTNFEFIFCIPVTSNLI